MRTLNIVLVFTTCLAPALAVAQDRSREPAASAQASGQAQADADAPLFEIRGLFDAGFRWRDVGGNDAKYREDLNYSTGPRLFNVDLSLSPTELGAVDLVNIYANQLGDPFESLGLTVKKFDSFTFRFRRNSSVYFYRDITLPHALADVSKSNGGDFRHFNFDRVNDRVDFDFRVAPRGKVFFNFNRQTRLGESTTVFDVSRDEFELDRPLDEVKNDYVVGFQAALDTVSFYFDQTYRDYESDGRVFLPGASLGENRDNATELFFYEQLLPFDFTMPQSTVKVNVRPNSRLTITGGFIFSDLTADFSHSEVARGISFQGQPLDTTVLSGGELERQTTLADIDVAYDVNEYLAVIGGVRLGSFDQDGELSQTLPPADRVETGVDISTDILEVGAQVFPTGGVSVTGGVRFEERETAVLEEAVTIDQVETERTTFFINGNARPSPMLSVLGEYERGTYDNPFTLVAPTTLDRLKARVRFLPVEGLAVTGVFYTRRVENDLARPTRGPAISRSTLSGAVADPTSLDTTDFTLHVAYDQAPATVFGAYTRREVSHDVVNLVDAGGTAFEHAALYQSDLDRLFGGVRVEMTDTVAAGTDLSYHRNRGSFGLDWEQYRVYGELLSPAGYLFKVTYQYNSLDEDASDFDDYSAHMNDAVGRVPLLVAELR